MIFNLLITMLGVEDRETIHDGMKGNVVRYSLKPFLTKYEYLDNEYLNIDLASMQGSTQPLNGFLFPEKLIEKGHTKKLINFNLTDVTGDQRLLELLLAKTIFTLSANFATTLQTSRLMRKIFQKPSDLRTRHTDFWKTNYQTFLKFI